MAGLFGPQRGKFSGGSTRKKAIPQVDGFDSWRKKQGSLGLGLGIERDDHVILPGVSNRERTSLLKVRDYVKEQTGEECKLPQHLIDDVYSMYVNKDIKRKPTTKGTTLKNKIIDKVYNSLTKVLTEDSPLFTQVLTREVAVYMQKIQRMLEEEEKKQNGGGGDGDDDKNQNGPGVFDDRGDGEDDGEGSKSGDEDGEGADGKGQAPSKEHAPDARHGDVDPLEKALDDILDSSERALDKAVNNATKKMEEIKDALGEEAMAELSDNEPDFLDTIDNLKSALKAVSINRESIRSVLVKILDQSRNYFSAKYTTKEEGIFESDELDDIEGLEYLHPALKFVELDNVVNISRVYEGKIDLYLDTSGSMSYKENFDGQNIRMIDLVKGIAIVLFRMNMLDKLYFFDTQLHEIKNINEFTILGFNKSGGTDFDNVVTQVKSNGRNSVVITDGEDGCEQYSEKVFWVGVGGTQFDSRWGDSRAFPEYKKNNQVVTYNSRNGLFDKLS
jgi:molecular chaperone GrpE (heat shock protein)